jgi:hypothetical protein
MGRKRNLPIAPTPHPGQCVCPNGRQSGDAEDEQEREPARSTEGGKAGQAPEELVEVQREVDR